MLGIRNNLRVVSIFSLSSVEIIANRESKNHP